MQVPVAQHSKWQAALVQFTVPYAQLPTPRQWNWQVAVPWQARIPERQLLAPLQFTSQLVAIPQLTLGQEPSALQSTRQGTPAGQTTLSPVGAAITQTPA